MKKHKNDIYEDDQNEGATESPVIAAATVLLLREREQLEVLMLQKTSKIEFGGMWVFPGGKIDPEDSSKAANEDEAAKYAAARETKEEDERKMAKGCSSGRWVTRYWISDNIHRK